MNKTEKLKAITKKFESLPAFPPVVMRLTKLVESPEVSAKDVGKLISSDHALGAKVLRLVNSPFYGFPGRISSISHATILLGFSVIKGAVLSASVFDLMEKSMSGLWKHSLSCAVAAGTISRTLQLPDPEEIATAALLHDIGKILIELSLKEDPDEPTGSERDPQASYSDTETKLGVNHAEIGAYLAKQWSLPEKLVLPIAYHHEPARAPILKERVAAVHIANGIVHAFNGGRDNDLCMPQISTEAWESIGMAPLDLDDLVNQIKTDVEEASGSILSSEG